MSLHRNFLNEINILLKNKVDTKVEDTNGANSVDSKKLSPFDLSPMNMNLLRNEKTSQKGELTDNEKSILDDDDSVECGSVKLGILLVQDDFLSKVKATGTDNPDVHLVRQALCENGEAPFEALKCDLAPIPGIVALPWRGCVMKFEAGAPRKRTGCLVDSPWRCCFPLRNRDRSLAHSGQDYGILEIIAATLVLVLLLDLLLVATVTVVLWCIQTGSASTGAHGGKSSPSEGSSSICYPGAIPMLVAFPPGAAIISPVLGIVAAALSNVAAARSFTEWCLWSYLSPIAALATAAFHIEKVDPSAFLYPVVLIGIKFMEQVLHRLSFSCISFSWILLVSYSHSAQASTRLPR